MDGGLGEDDSLQPGGMESMGGASYGGLGDDEDLSIGSMLRQRFAAMDPIVQPSGLRTPIEPRGSTIQVWQYYLSLVQYRIIPASFCIPPVSSRPALYAPPLPGQHHSAWGVRPQQSTVVVFASTNPFSR